MHKLTAAKALFIYFISFTITQTQSLIFDGLHKVYLHLSQLSILRQQPQFLEIVLICKQTRKHHRSSTLKNQLVLKLTVVALFPTEKNTQNSIQINRKRSNSNRVCKSQQRSHTIRSLEIFVCTLCLLARRSFLCSHKIVCGIYNTQCFMYETERPTENICWRRMCRNDVIACASIYTAAAVATSLAVCMCELRLLFYFYFFLSE